MKRYLCSLVALGLLVGVTGQAMAQPSCSFTILDVPGSSKASAIALGINASGQIVGSYYDAAYIHHGFLYDQGGYTTLDVPDSNYTHASGINASGQIVGYTLLARKSTASCWIRATIPRSMRPARSGPMPKGSTPPAKSWELTTMLLPTIP